MILLSHYLIRVQHYWPWSMDLASCLDWRLIILNGYQVRCNQKYSIGSNTTYCQQYWLLQLAGHANPNPQETFISDLTELVIEWVTVGTEVPVCLDANEEMDQLNPEEGLWQLISSTGLVDQHQNCFLGIPTWQDINAVVNWLKMFV